MIGNQARGWLLQQQLTKSLKLYIMASSKLKSTILLGLFLLISSMSYGQVVKLRTTELALRYEIDEYRWGEWSDFEDVSVLVVMDIDADRISIYSKETQVYDVIQAEEVRYDADGDKFMPYICINEDGVKCRVELATLNSQNGRNQLYVKFENMMFVYNLYLLD